MSTSKHSSYVFSVLCVFVSHTRIVLSLDAVANKAPFGDHAKAVKSPLCPFANDRCRSQSLFEITCASARCQRRPGNPETTLTPCSSRSSKSPPIRMPRDLRADLIVRLQRPDESIHLSDQLRLLLLHVVNIDYSVRGGCRQQPPTRVPRYMLHRLRLVADVPHFRHIVNVHDLDDQFAAFCKPPRRSNSSKGHTRWQQPPIVYPATKPNPGSAKCT